MKRKHLTIILIGLILVLIVALATAIHGCGHRGHPVLGMVTLEPNRESNISVSMSRSLLQPWRLRFGMPGGFDGESGYSGTVSISVTNDDKVPLLIDLGRGKERLSISPSNSHKIFEGSFDEMFMLGRTQIQEMTIVSSNDRRVHATFKFSHDLKNRSLEVILSTWRISYGP
jgi:hypothetical protein